MVAPMTRSRTPGKIDPRAKFAVEGVPLSYASNGDSNGVFYYLGTNKNTQAFSNPATSGAVVMSASSSYPGSYLPSNLTDRATTIFHSNSAANSWWKVDLLTAQLRCNYYSLRSRSDEDTQHLRSWKLRGSHDDSTWLDLDVQTNNTTLNSAGQWLSIPATGSTQFFRYLQIYMTGVNSSGGNFLVATEWELYGTLKE